ncbi:MAG: PAS domain-containing protein, partial [Steroidobacteraceae bacterium]
MHNPDTQGPSSTPAAREETAQSAGEARYRYAFEAAGVSLWEEDFTDVAVFLERLRHEGVRDFRAHFDRNPALVEAAVGLVKVRDVNRETLRVFGARSKEELKGSLARIFTDKSLVVFKEELIALAAGQPSLAADVEQRTLAGEIRQFMFTITFPEPAQPLNRVLVTLVDVTERKRAEQTLREQELRMRLALEATGAATWVIDYTRGGMESFDARACEMAGLDPSRKQWPAGTFCELLHPEDRALMQAASAATHVAAGRAVAERGPLMEYRIVRSDGQVRWLQGAGVVQS